MKCFVQQGILDRESDGFPPAFGLFNSTSAIGCLKVQVWPADLLVTTDFARTIHATRKHDLDLFLRPVHWIASSKNRSVVHCVILSPFEVHALLPSIRQHKTVTLHVYSCRVTMSMHTLENLSFCAFPAVPRCSLNPPITMLLNFFAGKLYLKSYEKYLLVCRFLGLASRPPDEQTQVACGEVMERGCPFTVSPVELLMVLVALRRKG